MKKILSVVSVSLFLCSLFVGIKCMIFPILMKEANYGLSHLKEKQAIDTVFIGSSMFRQGIDIDSLGEEEAYLLAYNGHQPYAEFLQLKELLDSGVQIKTLVVDMYAFTLTADITISDTRLLQDASPEFLLSIFAIMATDGEAGVSDLYELFVSANNELLLTWPISFPLINSRYKDGASVSDSQGGSTPEMLKRLNNNLGQVANLNQTQLAYLEELIALCDAQDIQLFFLETPKYIYLYENRGYCDIMREYIIFLQEKNCTLILSDETISHLEGMPDNDCKRYHFESDDASYFYDLIHMSSKGQQLFSSIVAPLLSQNSKTTEVSIGECEKYG